jgi:hypothetical protein
MEVNSYMGQSVSGIPLARRLGAFDNHSERFGGKKSLLHLPGFELSLLNFQARSLVAVPTTLFLLPILSYKVSNYTSDSCDAAGTECFTFSRT